MIPNPGCLPAPNQQRRHPDLPGFPGKNIGFPVPEGLPLFRAIAAAGGRMTLGQTTGCPVFAHFLTLLKSTVFS
jgi:hypothetical protein